MCQPPLGDENALDPPTAVLAMTALVPTRKLRLDTDIESWILSSFYNSLRWMVLTRSRSSISRSYC
jgi:hypothetical protein